MTFFFLVQECLVMLFQFGRFVSLFAVLHAFVNMQIVCFESLCRSFCDWVSWTFTWNVEVSHIPLNIKSESKLFVSCSFVSKCGKLDDTYTFHTYFYLTFSMHSQRSNSNAAKFFKNYFVKRKKKWKVIWISDVGDRAPFFCFDFHSPSPWGIRNMQTNNCLVRSVYKIEYNIPIPDIRYTIEIHTHIYIHATYQI